MKKRVVRLNIPRIEKDTEKYPPITKAEYERLQNLIEAFKEERKKPEYKNPIIQKHFDREILRLVREQLKGNGIHFYSAPISIDPKIKQDREWIE